MVEAADDMIVFLPQYGSGTSGTLLVVEAMTLKKMGVANWKEVALELEIKRRGAIPRESSDVEKVMQKLFLAIQNGVKTETVLFH